MEKDTVFVPCTAAEYKVKTKAGTIGELLEDAPLATALRLLGHQLFGFPMYLLFNLSAGSDSLPTPKTGMGVPTSHFSPLGGLFMSSQWVHVVLSDLGIVATFYILASVGQRIGLENVLLFYAMPYVWVNHWIGKKPCSCTCR
jgi:omega-6 fatty acid desaturase (delta-12 desaturase)